MSYDCDLIRLSDEAKARGLFLYFTFLELQKEVVGNPLSEAMAKALSVIRASASLEGLKEDPVVRAYRDFYWRLGIDPTKVRPSSEALARRALRGEFPRVSPLVDAGNVASLETLVPIGIYDLDLLRLPLVVRLSEAGERFMPIGGKEQPLPRGYPIMVDSSGTVVHIYAHRDSTLTSVRPSTRRALVVGTGVPKVPEDLVERAVRRVVELAKVIGWAPAGPLCEAKPDV